MDSAATSSLKLGSPRPPPRLPPVPASCVPKPLSQPLSQGMPPTSQKSPSAAAGAGESGAAGESTAAELQACEKDWDHLSTDEQNDAELLHNFDRSSWSERAVLIRGCAPCLICVLSRFHRRCVSLGSAG